MFTAEYRLLVQILRKEDPIKVTPGKILSYVGDSSTADSIRFYLQLAIALWIVVLQDSVATFSIISEKLFRLF